MNIITVAVVTIVVVIRRNSALGYSPDCSTETMRVLPCITLPPVSPYSRQRSPPGRAGAHFVQGPLHHCPTHKPRPPAAVRWRLGRLRRLHSGGGSVPEQRLGWRRCSGTCVP